MTPDPRVGRLETLVAQWLGLTLIRDLGELGSAFAGYNETGWRELRRAEKKILAMCANQLAAALAETLLVAGTHDPRTGICTRCGFRQAEGHARTCIHYEYAVRQAEIPPDKEA
jgi:hypothetical protein